MMVIELTFAGDSRRRLAARPAHRARLTQLLTDGDLLLAGPWDDDSGALLIFRTDERGLRRILDSDPYYTTPGVTVASVRHLQATVGTALR